MADYLPIECITDTLECQLIKSWVLYICVAGIILDLTTNEL